MVKKNDLLVLYFLQFYISSLWGENILTNSQEPEPHVFCPLEPKAEALEKKYQEPEPEPLGNKIRSRSRLETKNQELKYYPAPLLCLLELVIS